MKKRIAALFLAVLVIASSVVTLSSCDREYNESEVFSAAEDLIEKSKKMNEIFFGYGIMYDELAGGYSEGLDGIYMKAADYGPASLDEYGFTTVKELEEMTRSVYTNSYSDELIGIMISGVTIGGQIVWQARYVQVYGGAALDKPEYILVNTEFDPVATDDVEYLYDTMKVDEVDGEKRYVTLDCKVTNYEGKSQIRNIRVCLLEERNGFRLDGPTYIKYSEVVDEYEKLDK